MYQFENLFPYIDVERRLKSKSHYAYGWDRSDRERKQANDKLLAFTLSKHAGEEDQHNFDYMIEQCRLIDIKYLVLGPYGTQLVGGPMDATAFEQRVSLVFSDQYFDAINEALRVRAERNPGNYYHSGRVLNMRDVKTVTVRNGSYARFRSWEVKATALKKHTGVWSVETGKKVPWRTAVTEFWKLGFLTERSIVRYAGNPIWGSSDDVRSYNELLAVLDKRNTRPSALRGGVKSAMKKINREFDFPSDWRVLDQEFNLA